MEDRNGIFDSGERYLLIGGGLQNKAWLYLWRVTEKKTGRRGSVYHGYWVALKLEGRVVL